MSLHQRITSPEAHLQAYCNGEPDLTYFARAEWLDAAQASLDNGSDEPLAELTAETDARHGFRDWQGDLPWREDVEFEQYVERIAPVSAA